MAAPPHIVAYIEYFHNIHDLKYTSLSLSSLRRLHRGDRFKFVESQALKRKKVWRGLYDAPKQLLST